MTFSMPPRGLEDTMHGSPSEVGLQQSETRHVEGEQGRSVMCPLDPGPNCTEDRLLGRPSPDRFGGLSIFFEAKKAKKGRA